MLKPMDEFDGAQLGVNALEAVRRERLADLTHDWLEVIGEDTNREGILKTPQRVAKAWDFLTGGYRMSLEEVANDAVFAAEGSQMVVVKDIEFYSMCEHHMLPFFGRAHIGYIPKDKILGLSKFARITDLFARRLQVQERITTQIAEAVMVSSSLKVLAWCSRGSICAWRCAVCRSKTRARLQPRCSVFSARIHARARSSWNRSRIRSTVAKTCLKQLENF